MNVNKIVCSGIEYKDPDLLTRNGSAVTLTDGSATYAGEISSTPTVEIKYNNTITTYHSQVFAKITAATGLVIPIFELTPSSTSEIFRIGKVVLNVHHQAGANFGGVNYDLVGTQASGTQASSTSLFDCINETPKSITVDTIGTNANL